MIEYIAIVFGSSTISSVVIYLLNSKKNKVDITKVATEVYNSLISELREEIVRLKVRIEELEKAEAMYEKERERMMQRIYELEDKNNVLLIENASLRAEINNLKSKLI